MGAKGARVCVCRCWRPWRPWDAQGNSAVPRTHPRAPGGAWGALEAIRMTNPAGWSPLGLDGFLDQLLDGLVDLVVTRVAHPLVADHARVVDQVEGRERLDAEHLGHRPACPVEPVVPRHRLLLQELGQRLLVVVATDTQQRE